MTVKATINPGLKGGNRSDSIDRYAARLYEHPAPVLALVELLPVDRVVPIDGGSSKDPLVRLTISALEVAAPGEQDRILRDVLRLLFLSRTAEGTLDGDNEMKLAEQTLEQADGLIAGEQVASLVATLNWTLARIAELAADEKLRPVDIRKSLAQIADRAGAAKLGAQGKDGPAW